MIIYGTAHVNIYKADILLCIYTQAHLQNGSWHNELTQYVFRYGNSWYRWLYSKDLILDIKQLVYRMGYKWEPERDIHQVDWHNVYTTNLKLTLGMISNGYVDTDVIMDLTNRSKNGYK